MQLLTLTDSESGDSIVVNADYLISISTMQRRTMVTLEGKILVFVKESVQEIKAKLAGVTLAEA